MPQKSRSDLSRLRRLQEELARKVELRPFSGRVSLVAGMDVSLGPRGSKRGFAAAVLYSFPALEHIQTALGPGPLDFPYIPGLLSFRELPLLLAALERLSCTPDLLLVDGQGFAHPRRFGVACHLSLECGIPAVGVAKSRLVGEHVEPGRERGSWSALTVDGEEVGRVLRTRDGVKPLYISAGSGLTLDECVDYTLACTPKYRLPEPVREADRRSREAAKGALE